jgi:hypothetical protein
MTLKEKFEEIKIVVEDRNLRLQYIDEKNNCINLCEKIAEEFAIGFAEWAIYYSFNGMYSDDVKELLEIYKKEKGL